MKIINKLWRWWSPKRYCQRRLARATRDWEKKLQAAKSLSSAEQHNLHEERYHDLEEWYAWLNYIEDVELIRKASGMDVHLDDIPIPDEEREPWEPADRHYVYRADSYPVLVSECRDALRKAMRERGPAYRKERREVWELWIKAGTLAVAFVTAFAGLVGTLIGYVSLKK